MDGPIPIFASILLKTVAPARWCVISSSVGVLCMGRLSAWFRSLGSRQTLRPPPRFSVNVRLDTQSVGSVILVITPPKVLLLCRSWGACVPRRSQRLCQLEFLLLVGTTMLDRLWARGQTKCNTLLMLATSVFGRIYRRPCYVMAQPKSRLDIPWPNDAECMGHVWYLFSCWYPLLFDVESLAGCVGG